MNHLKTLLNVIIENQLIKCFHNVHYNAMMLCVVAFKTINLAFYMHWCRILILIMYVVALARVILWHPYFFVKQNIVCVVCFRLCQGLEWMTSRAGLR